MAVMHSRVIMVLVSLSVTLLLVGIVGAKYTNKIYIDENCGKTVTTDKISGEIHLTRGKGCAASKCNCSMRLTYTKDVKKRLKVKYTQLDLGENDLMRCLGTIRIYSINGDQKKIVTEAMCTDPQIRGSETQADKNVLYFEVKLGNYPTPKVSMFWTVFHEAKSECEKDEFKCNLISIRTKLHPCVSKSLKCDGYDNCDDMSDEEKETAACVGGAIGVTPSPGQLSMISLAAILLLKLFL